MITGFCHSSSWRQGVAFGWIFGLLGVPEWLFWEGFSRLKVLVKMPCWILNEPVKSLAFCDGRSFDRFWAICAPKWLRCPPTSVKVNTKEWCLSNTWCVKGVYVKPSRVLWRMNWWSWRNIWQWKSTSCGKNPRKDWDEATSALQQQVQTLVQEQSDALKSQDALAGRGWAGCRTQCISRLKREEHRQHCHPNNSNCNNNDDDDDNDDDHDDDDDNDKNKHKHKHKQKHKHKHNLEVSVLAFVRPFSNKACQTVQHQKKQYKRLWWLWCKGSNNNNSIFIY